MTSYTLINDTTLADFTTLNPLLYPQLWSKLAQKGVKAKEWLSKFEGSSEDSIIWVNNDELAKAGNQVNFTTEAELVGDKVQGSTTAVGAEEKEAYNTYINVVDIKRHSVGRDERMIKFSAAAVQSSMTIKLSSWMAHLKQEEALMKMVKDCAYTTLGQTDNLFRPGSGATEADLTANSLFDTSLMETAVPKLESVGALPVSMSLKAGSELREFACFASHRMITGLDNDAQWNATNLNARARENGGDLNNPLIDGSFGMYKGVRLYKFSMPDHDNPANGAIGSALEARGLLRTATVSVSDTTTITFGGSTATSSTILYAKFFAGYDYLFTSDQAANPDTNTYYFLIINRSGANTGKLELCSYVGTSNNGNQIANCQRGLNSQDSNYSAAHPAGSLIVQCTSNGVPYGWVPFLGACAILRSYGAYAEKMTFEKQDYEFISGACIGSIFGQTTAKRVDGKIKNLVLAQCAVDPLK